MSSSYTGFERNLARVLSKFPVIKKIIKTLYSRVVYILNKKNERVLSDYDVFTISNTNNETFFGYYDKCPENNRKQVLYFESIINTQELPSNNKEIYLNSTSNETSPKKIKAYNWQQGARAIWLDDNHFVVNDYNDVSKSYVAHVYSSDDSSTLREYPYPVQDTYGFVYYLSINYARLMALRPDYGYRNKTPLDHDELQVIDNDGVWKVDYQSGDTNLIVSIKDALDYSNGSNPEGALHKINHVMISPTGDYFIFMHRYLVNGQRFDRLILSDSNGNLLRVLADYGMVSHCNWLNNDTVIGYFRVGTKDAYWLINIHDGSITHFLDGKLDQYGDGHPSVFGDYVVTDTYPNKARMQQLILVNWRTGSIKKLGEFYHSFKFSGETRCDLHPRFSYDGKMVYFDSVFTGKRQLHYIAITDVVL